MTFDLWSCIIGLMIGTPFGIILSAMLLSGSRYDDSMPPTFYREPRPLDSLDDQ